MVRALGNFVGVAACGHLFHGQAINLSTRDVIIIPTTWVKFEMEFVVDGTSPWQLCRSCDYIAQG
ncbi:hypothetical protein CIK87_05090 [Prevotella sp. P5-64]|nr:hypothetical protein CIK87_05090 [Prevotella sp. P5-64]